jgi:hypothetical protein
MSKASRNWHFLVFLRLAPRRESKKREYSSTAFFRNFSVFLDSIYHAADYFTKCASYQKIDVSTLTNADLYDINTTFPQEKFLLWFSRPTQKAGRKVTCF